jgi:hypothetical protein
MATASKMQGLEDHPRYFYIRLLNFSENRGVREARVFCYDLYALPRGLPISQ